MRFVVHSAAQEIRYCIWNLKIHYCVYKTGPPTWAMTLYACDAFCIPSKCLVEMWHILVSIMHIDSAMTFSVCILQAALCALTEEGFSVQQVNHIHFMQVWVNDQLDAQLCYIKRLFFIIILYMIRASLCSSSGGWIVLIQHMV